MEETYYKVNPKGDSTYCVYEADQLGICLQDWLDNLNDGEVLEVQTVKMTEDEFNKLPEYEG